MSGLKTLVYLATPYSHESAFVRTHRFHVVNQAAARLTQEGVHVYSPISHTHPIAMEGDLPLGWDYWEQYDRAILNACCKMIVLRQNGWTESKGVQAEIKIAVELGIPVEYMDP